MRRPVAIAVPILLALAGCSGGDGATEVDLESLAENEALCLDGDRFDRPVIDWIDAAVELAVDQYDEPAFFEISADRQRVSVIVSVEGTAEQLFYCGAAGYTSPTSIGEAAGSTFAPEAVDFDVDTIFGEIDDQLGEPSIGDFAIVGDGTGSAAYDVSVQSDAGGVLRVRLGPNGAILGVQAQ